MTMIQCIHCMSWFHNDCMQIKKDEVIGSFACFDCHIAHKNIAKNLDIVSTMKKTIDDITAENTRTKTALEEIKNECHSLKQENKELLEKLNQLQKITHDSASPSLLIGDSLLRDFDEKKLNNTTVKPLNGAKVADLKPHIEQAKLCQRVIICVGTNDCSSEDFDGEKITAEYKELVNVAKSKVINSPDVIISSIPPRMDSLEYQENVENLNAGLCTIARDTGATFINNDETFRLGDRSPNDGYILSDGLHLTNKGSNRLARNVNVTQDPKVNICKAKKTSKANAAVQKNEYLQDRGPEEEWQTVQRGRKQRGRTYDVEEERCRRTQCTKSIVRIVVNRITAPTCAGMDRKSHVIIAALLGTRKNSAGARFAAKKRVPSQLSNSHSRRTFLSQNFYTRCN